MENERGLDLLVVTLHIEHLEVSYRTGKTRETRGWRGAGSGRRGGLGGSPPMAASSTPGRASPGDFHFVFHSPGL